eukprot:3936645-Rhodomonas_salina.1
MASGPSCFVSFSTTPQSSNTRAVIKATSPVQPFPSALFMKSSTNTLELGRGPSGYASKSGVGTDASAAFPFRFIARSLASSSMIVDMSCDAAHAMGGEREKPKGRTG